MDLLYKSISTNDFGLRKWFPWTCRYPRQAPWMTDFVSERERSYVWSIMQDISPWVYMTVRRIENPYLWGQYALRYEEMKADHTSRCVSEYIVVHATSFSNAYKIADHNFDWRLARRCRYGHGVSFARDSSYANIQATKNEVYIISGILVANTHIGNYKTHIPYDVSDTTVNRQRSVYVKYNDNEFYPYYVVY